MRFLLLLSALISLAPAAYALELGLSLGFQKSTGIINLDHAELQTWAATHTPGITLDNLSRSTYRFNHASSIAASAGIPSGYDQGNQTGLTIGLTGATSTQANLRLDNRTEVLAEADSGSCTEIDPCIITGRDFTGTTGTQLDLDADDATEYWLEIQNSEFGDTTGITARIRDPLVNVVFKNIKGDATASQSHFFRTDGGDIDIQQSEFSGIAATNFIFVHSSATNNNLSISVTNSDFNRDDNDWTSTRLINMNDWSGNTGTVIWNNNEADWSSTTFQPDGILGAGNDDIDTLTMTGNIWNGGDNFIDQGNFGSAPLSKWSNITITNNNILDTDENTIDLTYVDTVDISYNYLRHESDGTGYRLIWIRHDTSNSGVRPDDITIHHNKYNKTVADSGSGDEGLGLQGAMGAVNIYNEYAEDQSEDFIEVNLLGESLTSLDIYNIVSSETGESIVTVDRSLNETGWTEWTTGEQDFTTNTYVRNVYGSSTEWCVSIRGIKGVVVHDVYCDNSSGSDESINVDDWDNTSTPMHDIFVAGALPLDAEVGAGSGNQITIVGAGGDNIDFAYIDEAGTLQTD